MYSPKEKAKSDQPLKFAAFYLDCLLLFTLLPSPPLESAVEGNVLWFPLFIHHIPEMCILHFLFYPFLRNYLGFFNVPLSHLSSSSNWAKVKETILYFSTGEIRNNGDRAFAWIIVVQMSYFLMCLGANRNQTEPAAEHSLDYRDRRTNAVLLTFSVPEADLKVVNGSNGQSAYHKLSHWRGCTCRVQKIMWPHVNVLCIIIFTVNEYSVYNWSVGFSTAGQCVYIM